ncbi:DNA/RNA nuclease SfsA [Oceaniserpentilla sp. 4NH20-0058]|uniref:DNA/RNA nuclease SfsA n=1 Tax=Oceaniserpentilla sp. 4NH20-0058 TaxID=3127660 RepID=UPI0031074809
MKFEFPLQKGKWIKRYKRFMVDLALPNGEELTVHSANTGSMKNCFVEGGEAWFWDSQNEKRKYPHSLELTETSSGHVACINTSRPNYLVAEAIENGTVKELQDYQVLKTEVKYGDENSRIDILLSGGEKNIYVEVKNTTLLEKTSNGQPDEIGNTDEGVGYFPDSVSERASKHLRELIRMVELGHRGVIFFCVNHTGIKQVKPADHIDTVYGQLLRQAKGAGVEILAYASHIDNNEIYLHQALPVVL